MKMECVNSKPLISIITVVYNGDKYLEETIESVKNQTYENIEYIIIDGGSTDNTIDIIKKYQNKIDYWVSEKDEGLYDAFNKGIMLSKGSYVGIISSDDWLHDNAIEKMVSSIKKNKADVYYANLDLIKDDLSVINVTAPESVNGIKKKMTVFHPATLIKKSAYKEFGLYDKSFKIAADYDLLLRYYVNGVKFQRVDFTMASFREGGVSSYFSWNNLMENIRARKNNNCRGVYFKEVVIYVYFRVKRLFK
ncbi:glycosyltransferase family 2 protein [Vibrio atlanticus]|uniref:Putative glycosyltransferase EpsE n=1 Tax=Vibrio atlanticus TaxID=693153 RepID=A0A1C3IIH1_9VIBR|nr:glycosyltransferase family 2 protein [Vibrio atlanticus]SBS61206.1 Putative glycosyltransferase EpsE [Vibrio atlanticus]